MWTYCGSICTDRCLLAFDRGDEAFFFWFLRMAKFNFKRLGNKVWLAHPRKLSCCWVIGLPIAVDSANGAFIREALGEPNDKYLRLEFISCNFTESSQSLLEAVKARIPLSKSTTLIKKSRVGDFAKFVPLKTE